MDFNSKVRTCFMFRGNGHEAAEFYVSLLPGSEIEASYDGAPGKPPLVIEFTLAGVSYMILNDGPPCAQTMATSISVLTEDQAETDTLWEKLLADGGEESMCGWLVDQYGLHWQVVPKPLIRRIHDPDREAAGRAMAAMMTMRKIDIAAIEAAFGGV